MRGGLLARVLPGRRAPADPPGAPQATSARAPVPPSAMGEESWRRADPPERDERPRPGAIPFTPAG